MSDPKRTSSFERVGAGKPLPMPNFPYQSVDGKSGGAASGTAPTKTEKIPALQNFVWGT